MIENLIEKKKKELSTKGYIQFSDAEIANFKENEIEQIENAFKGFGLLKLPPKEIEFFEWLKKEDEPVWNDLWDTEDDAYQISIDFLHQFLRDQNGFPICDLENEDNYWFTAEHIKPKGKQHFESINLKLKTNQKLNVEELLLYEVVHNSIDIWHFSFRYKINLEKAKELVSAMHQNDILVHLTEREDLMKYMDF